MRYAVTASGFVDIHSHILYGLDDGAKTKEESVAMLRLAHSTGTLAIVATPHANAQYRFDPRMTADRIAALQGTTAVRIYPGCDFRLQFDNIEDAVAHPQRYTVNHGPYLMVEFPDVGTLHAADRILGRLMDASIVPVITHPERNSHIQRHLDDLAEWVASGCYAQVTAGSFLGTFGQSAKKSAETLLARGLAHIVASDAHDTKSRTPNLRDAFERLADEHGEDRIRPLFVENPIAIVSGAPLDFEPVPVSAKGRKWYHFWA